MKLFSHIKSGTILANTYDNGITVEFYKMGKRTKTGFKMVELEFSEDVVIAYNSTVNGGFHHSNWFTKDNKPELFINYKKTL